MKQSDWVYKELCIALECEKKEQERDPKHQKILLLAEDGFKFPAKLPKPLEELYHREFYSFRRDTFKRVMDKLCEKCIYKKKLNGVVDWRNQVIGLKNIYLTSRAVIEEDLATFENRFGADFVEKVKMEQPLGDVVQRVRHISMSCYAANTIFADEKNQRVYLDPQSCDLGAMFKMIKRMLEDEEFTFELIFTAPDSAPVTDAIDNKKLGNRALESFPRACFLSSYYYILKLIEVDPVFQKAYNENRFRYMVTDAVLPYALFIVEYKEEYKKYDHIKIDLYSEFVTSCKERPSMLIFADDKDHYSFFKQRYEKTRRLERSKELIDQHGEEWLEEWKKMVQEIAHEKSRVHKF